MKTKNAKKTAKKDLRLRIAAIVLTVLAIVMMMFPGVDGDGDITDKLVAVAMGIDYTDGMLNVTINSVLPKSGEEGGVESVPVSQRGESVEKCLDGIERKTGRSLELGLCGVIVVGDELAREGMLSVMSILLSGALVSPGVYVVQADGDSAENIIRTSSMFAFESPTALTQLVKSAEKSIGGCPVTLLKFVSDSYGKTETAYAPLLSVKKAPALYGSGESSSGEKFQPDAITNNAVYKGGVMAGRLSAAASIGLSYYGSGDTKGMLICPHFTIAGVDIGTVTAESVGSDVKVEAVFRDGAPFASLKVSVTIKSADRERVNAVAMRENLSEAQIEEAFMKNYEELIISEVRQAYDESRAMSCDVFDIEQKLYRFHTNEYKNFIKSGGKILDECRVEISAKIKIL